MLYDVIDKSDLVCNNVVECYNNRYKFLGFDSPLPIARHVMVSEAQIKTYDMYIPCIFYTVVLSFQERLAINLKVACATYSDAVLVASILRVHCNFVTEVNSCFLTNRAT